MHDGKILTSSGAEGQCCGPPLAFPLRKIDEFHSLYHGPFTVDAFNQQVASLPHLPQAQTTMIGC